MVGGKIDLTVADLRDIYQKAVGWVGGYQNFHEGITAKMEHVCLTYSTLRDITDFFRYCDYLPL